MKDLDWSNLSFGYRAVLYARAGQYMGGEGIQRIAPGGCRPDCRTLPDDGAFDQDEL